MTGVEVEETLHASADAGCPPDSLPAGSKESQAGSSPAQETSALCTLVRHAQLTSMDVSELSSCRESFGLAWLLLFLIREEGRKAEDFAIRHLDLSECEVSSRKIFLLLSFFSPTIEELTLVRGRALPLLLRFLERLQGEGRETNANTVLRSIKKIRFAAGSLGLFEAPGVLSALPGRLEGLCLKGNALNAQSVHTLAQALRTSRYPSLVQLDLSECSLDDPKMDIICSALTDTQASRSKIESLRLGPNPVDSQECVLKVISAGALPFLNELSLPSVEGLVEMVREGKLSSLEVLDLGGVRKREKEVAVGFPSIFRSSLLPRLKHLNLRSFFPWTLTEDETESVLTALKAEEAPPVETVELSLDTLSERHARLLGGGRGGFRCLQTLQLCLMPAGALAFFNAVRLSSEGLHLKSLNLYLKKARENPQVMEALSEGVLMGRLDCLTDLVFDSKSLGPADKRLLFGTLEKYRLPQLSHLWLHFQEMTDECVVALAAVVRSGNLGSVKRFDVAYNDFGKKGIEALMAAVGEVGMPSVESFFLWRTRIGEGGEVFGKALQKGHDPNNMFPRLRSLYLSRCGLEDAGLGAFGEAVGRGCLLSLRSLYLAGNDFGVEGLNGFVEGVREGGLLRLENLILNETKAGMVGEGLASVIGEGKLPRLRHLALNSSGFTSRGMGALGKALRGVDSEPAFLERLGLSKNPEIGEDGLTSFVEALESFSLSNLWHLNIKDSGIQSERAQSIVTKAQEEGKLSPLTSII